MRCLLIIIIPLLPTPFYFLLVYIFIYDGEDMIGDGGKHEQSTVTWYDVVKFVGEFRNGKMEKNFVKEPTLLEFYAP